MDGIEQDRGTGNGQKVSRNGGINLISKRSKEIRKDGPLKITLATVQDMDIKQSEDQTEDGAIHQMLVIITLHWVNKKGVNLKGCLN